MDSFSAGKEYKNKRGGKMTEKGLKQKAENFIIDRYKLNECYREDNEETRRYMRMDVHSQYEEEYQLYLAGLHEAQSQLTEKDKQIEELQEVRAGQAKLLNQDTERIMELETQIEKMKCCTNCRYCNQWGEVNPNSPNCKKCNWLSNWKLKE